MQRYFVNNGDADNNFAPVVLAAFTSLYLPFLNLFLSVKGEEGLFLKTFGIGVKHELAIILGGYVILNLAGVSLFRWSSKLSKIYIAALYSFMSFILMKFESENLILQVFQVVFSLFIILYVLWYRVEPFHRQIRKIYLLHSVFFVSLYVVALHYNLFDRLWVNCSFMLHLSLLLGFFILMQKKDLPGIRPVLLAIILLFTLIALTTLLVEPNYGLFASLLVLSFVNVRMMAELKYRERVINLFFENPYKLLVSTFFVIIVFGTIALYLPIASVSKGGISLVDSFFTSTSATCVTGLTVLDTGSDFSFIGQLIILLLIQAGGLGIVTIMTFVAIALGQSLGIHGEHVVGEIIGSKRPKLINKIIKLIVTGTAIIEAVGAAVLSISYFLEGMPLKKALWHAIFHSVSAFCNAGFSLNKTSFIEYQNHYPVIMILAVLIIIGGVGFPVWVFAGEYFSNKQKAKKISLFVKITIITTLLLLVFGYVNFYVIESNYVFKNLSTISKNLNAFFLSVTARTAGFNTVDTAALRETSLLLLCILMFIGGGTASTAGGIKVTTVGVIYGAVASLVRGRDGVVMFEREIPRRIVYSALILLTLSIFIVVAFALLLRSSQPFSMFECVFESVSAFGTVGLSMGITASLDSFGKALITILMFVGRLSPLTFLYLLAAKSHRKVRYPGENIMIG